MAVKEQPSELLFSLAQKVADRRSHFFEIKGPGKGDKDSSDFMSELRKVALQTFGDDYSEKKVCGDNKLSVDFFFPVEGTIVEIALSLRNSNSEFERDMIKAILAQKAGNQVRRLLFVSKPGAIDRHREPASVAMISMLKRDFGISTEILEMVNH